MLKTLWPATCVPQSDDCPFLH